MVKQVISCGLWLLSSKAYLVLSTVFKMWANGKQSFGLQSVTWHVVKWFGHYVKTVLKPVALTGGLHTNSDPFSWLTPPGLRVPSSIKVLFLPRKWNQPACNYSQTRTEYSQMTPVWHEALYDWITAVPIRILDTFYTQILKRKSRFFTGIHLCTVTHLRTSGTIMSSGRSLTLQTG